jgi:hypothetical protein
MDLSRWYIIDWCNPCTSGLGTALSIDQSLSIFSGEGWGKPDDTSLHDSAGRGAADRCSASGSAGPMSPNPTFELASTHPIDLLMGRVI